MKKLIISLLLLIAGVCYAQQWDPPGFVPNAYHANTTDDAALLNGHPGSYWAGGGAADSDFIKVTADTGKHNALVPKSGTHIYIPSGDSFLNVVVPKAVNSDSAYPRGSIMANYLGLHAKADAALLADSSGGSARAWGYTFAQWLALNFKFSGSDTSTGQFTFTGGIKSTGKDTSTGPQVRQGQVKITTDSLIYTYDFYPQGMQAGASQLPLDSAALLVRDSLCFRTILAYEFSKDTMYFIGGNDCHMPRYAPSADSLIMEFDGYQTVNQAPESCFSMIGLVNYSILNTTSDSILFDSCRQVNVLDSVVTYRAGNTLANLHLTPNANYRWWLGRRTASGHAMNRSDYPVHVINIRLYVKRS